MIIGVAGPYSADTAEQRRINIDKMNSAAARLLELGHVPIIGMNAAYLLLKWPIYQTGIRRLWTFPYCYQGL